MLLVPNTAVQVKTLTEKGMAVSVVSFTRQKNDPFCDYALNDIKDINVVDLGLNKLQVTGLFKIFAYLRGIIKTGFYLLGNQSFVYIYFPGPAPLLTALLCALMGKKYALYVRGVWKTTGLYHIVSRYVFRKAQFIFTTGTGFRDIISKYNKNVEPVYPMTTFDVRSVADMKRNKTNDIKNLLFVGHIRKRKGILDVVTSISLLKKQGIIVCLKVIGGGDSNDVAELQKLVAQLSVSDEVKYIGHVSDARQLEKHFQKADLFLYPSYYPEGFPRVVFEAMIFGMPIICTILTGMRGFMEDKVNCLEVPAESAQSITDAIVLLKNDPVLSLNIGNKAQKMAKDYFNSFTIQGHEEQFYHKLMNIKNHGS